MSLQHALADAIRNVRKIVFPPEELELLRTIETAIKSARARNISLGQAEIEVQRAIEADPNVDEVTVDFAFGAGMSMDDWSVTVRFYNGKTVAIPHHS